MPGIVAIVTKMPREQAVSCLMEMMGTLRHEGFYTTGTWIAESLGVYIAWVARKGSFSDGAHLWNERGDVILVFSGEDFPEPGTAARLREHGHDFNAEGPSYLVHVAEEDPSFPAKLNGRFHGVLADRNRGTVVLFNDRYGMHRLYYHEGKEAFYFAAEAKAILAVRPELRRMDARGAGEFVACGAVLENRTIFDRIHLLPPASAWIFRDGRIERKTTYFHDSEWEQQEILDPETYYQELRSVFTRNLPRYFDGSQPIGMSLTGGLDSRIILACRKPTPGSLPCYTFGSMFRENEDVRVARKVARICNQTHEVITAGQEFLSQFPRYAERAVYLTDGCVDVSRAPDLYLNERARVIAPVRMSGNYGGEVLRRVRAFKAVDPMPGLFSPEFLSSVRETKETFAGIFRGHPVSLAVFKQGPWHLYGILALEQTQLSMRSPFLDNDFVRTVFRSPLSAFAGNEISLRLIADGNRALLRIPTDRGVVGNRGRFAGATSRGVLEFLFKTEYAYDLGMPQWLARLDHVFSPLHLDKVFLGRHKPFHFRVWYRDSLARYVQEMLLDQRSLSRSYIERKGLEVVVRGHLRGDRNYTSEIHNVLTLELLHRLFLDSTAEARSAAEYSTGTATV